MGGHVSLRRSFCQGRTAHGKRKLVMNEDVMDKSVRRRLRVTSQANARVLNSFDTHIVSDRNTHPVADGLAKKRHDATRRGKMTFPKERKLTLAYCDSIFCSVFRPAKCSDWLLQEAHIFWGLAKVVELVWELREGSHRPPYSSARTAARVQCFV